MLVVQCDVEYAESPEYIPNVLLEEEEEDSRFDEISSISIHQDTSQEENSLASLLTQLTPFRNDKMVKRMTSSDKMGFPSGL
jgi:uncharacterized iron-regulated protein